MEQKQNIDIERCKELFAYEMTEVILNLKGEFAAVSGKDTRYAKARVSQEKLTPTVAAVPAVELEPVAVTAPGVQKHTPVTLPQVTVEKFETALPQVKAAEAVPAVQVAVELPQVAVPEVKAAPVFAVQVQTTSVQVKVPEVKTPGTVKLPEQSVSAPEVKIPQIPGFDRWVCPAAAVENPPLQIPRTDIAAKLAAKPGAVTLTPCKVKTVQVKTAQTVSIPDAAPVECRVAVPQVQKPAVISPLPETGSTGVSHAQKRLQEISDRALSARTGWEVKPAAAPAPVQVKVPEVKAQAFTAQVETVEMLDFSRIAIPEKPDVDGFRKAFFGGSQ